MNIKKFGWKPDLPDHRDHILTLPVSIQAAKLATKVDLRSGCPAVYDQGNLGSCTAQALAALVAFLFKKQKKTVYTPSRLFIYYNERVLEGTVSIDCGATIRSGMKVLNKQGSPRENLWPYVIRNFAKKPTTDVYKDGLKHLVTSYQRVNNANLGLMKTVLSNGTPIVGGFTVFESFITDAVARTGIVPMPNLSEGVLGGHAILVVGYDDTKNWFIVRNSWGSSWGDRGYFYIPYDYFTNTNLADDFWTATVVV